MFIVQSNQRLESSHFLAVAVTSIMLGEWKIDSAKYVERLEPLFGYLVRCLQGGPVDSRSLELLLS